MALQVGELFASLNMDTRGFDQGTQRAEGGFGKLKGMIIGLGIGAAVIKVGGDMIKAASDAAEMQSKFDTVFGETKGAAEQWAASFANAAGRSTNEIKDHLATQQNMLVGFGLSRDAAAKMSEQIVKTGTDLASFNNLEDNDAIDKMSSALMGQNDAARGLGAVLNDVTLAEQMHKMGLKGKFAALDEATKIQVRYGVIVGQNADALRGLGDATETSASFANQVKRLQGNWKDFLATVGQFVLPLLGHLLFYINKLFAPMLAMIPVVAKLFKGAFKEGGVHIAGLSAAFEKVGAVFVKIWAFLQPLLQMLWDFIVWLVKDIIAYFQSLAPVLVQLVSAFGDLMDGIIEFLKPLMPLFKFIFNYFIAVAKYTWNTLKNVISFGLQAIRGIMMIIGGLLKGDWGKVWAGVKVILAAAWTYMKTAFSNGLKFLNDITGGAMGRIGEALWKPIKAAYDKIGKFISGIKKWFAGLTGGTVKLDVNASSNIPNTASGGLFSSAAIRRIGEAGTEAVVPLGNNSAAKGFAAAFVNRINAISPMGYNMAGAGGINVNVYGGTKDPRALAKEISVEIARQTMIKNRAMGVQ